LYLAPQHEDIWGVEAYIHAMLTSALDERERLDSRPDRFYPWEEGKSPFPAAN